jgi:hypothetical protein
MRRIGGSQEVEEKHFEGENYHPCLFHSSQGDHVIRLFPAANRIGDHQDLPVLFHKIECCLVDADDFTFFFPSP